MTYYCGIDPGLHGAVAVLDAGGKLKMVTDAPIIEVKKASGGKKHVYLPAQMFIILESVPRSCITRIVMEQVGAMPGQGVHSMFLMGVGVGLWTMALAAWEIPYEFVTPQSWKKSFGLSGSDKQNSIVRALQLVPSAAPFLTLKKHDGRAEAILLAEWLRRKVRGLPKP